jgi:hypothetical protein
MNGRLAHFAPPNDGCWVGVATDYTAWDYNLTRYINSVGYNPGAWNIFVHLPMNKLEKEKLEALLPYMGKFKGIAVLTVEPWDGLTPDMLSNKDIEEFVKVVRLYEEARGLRTVIRFAHEMNGHWYKWCASAAAAAAAAAGMA